MATIGQTLTAPETGWRRYDDTDSRIVYSGSWTQAANAGLYNGTFIYANTNNSYLTFKFYGTKLRIMGSGGSGRPNGKLIIDGNSYSDLIEGTSNTIYQILLCDIQNLTLGIHTVTINVPIASGYFIFDAIDIDNTGYLIHPTLNQVSDINSMQIGDCIPCRYTASTSGSAGYFSELGICVANDIPITGTATPDGLFYFIKVKHGKLIADRVIQTSISWDTLNTAKYIEGITQCIRVIPPMTANNTPIPLIVTASSSFSGSYTCYPYTAFNNVNTANTNGEFAWATGTVTNDWICIDMGSAKTINCYKIMGGTGFNTLSISGIKSWVIEGSNDNSNWTTIHTVTNTPVWNNYEERYWNFSAVSYRYYRLRLTDAYGTTPVLAEITFGNQLCIIRSLSGGVAYMDANGNPSTTDQGLGTWPSINEWDTYIVNSTLNGKISAGDDNIWHWNNGSNIGSWCKNTPMVTLYADTYRIYRGVNNAGTTNIINEVAVEISSNAKHGFRPVLNYIESDIASEVIY